MTRLTLHIASAAIAWLPQVNAKNEIAFNYSDVDVSGWNCYLCEFDQYSSRQTDASINSISPTAGEAHFGRESGIDEDKTYITLNLKHQAKIENGVIWSFSGSELGKSTRQINVEMSRVNQFGLKLRSQRQPFNVDRSGRTPFRHSANQLVLDREWVSSFSTDGFETFEHLANSVYLRSERSEEEIAGWVRINKQLVADLSISQQQKLGTRQRYVDSFYSSAAYPQPVDQTTTVSDLNVRHQLSRVESVFQFQRTRFRPGFKYLVAQSPYETDSALLISGFEPGVSSSMVRFESQYEINSSSRVHLDLVRRRQAQKGDEFIPYSANAALAVPAMAFSPKDLRANLRAASIAYRGKLSRHFVIETSIRESKRADSRPSATLDPYVGDLYQVHDVPMRNIDLSNREFSFATKSRLFGKGQLGFNVSRGFIERTDQEINRNSNTKKGLEFTYPFGNRLKIQLRYASDARDASAFIQTTMNHPDTRRFHMADRKNELWGSSVELKISTHWSIDIGSKNQFTNYSESNLGLKQIDEKSRFWKVKYVQPKKRSLEIYHGGDSLAATTDGNDWSQNGWWELDHSNSGHSKKIQVHEKALFGSRFDISLHWFELEGKVHDRSSSIDGKSLFPAINSNTQRGVINVHYQAGQRNSVSLQWLHQEHDAENWRIDSVEPTSITNVLGLGLRSPSYSLHTVGLEWQSSF